MCIIIARRVVTKPDNTYTKAILWFQVEIRDDMLQNLIAYKINNDYTRSDLLIFNYGPSRI